MVFAARNGSPSPVKQVKDKQQLFHELERFGMLEFVRSGMVAVTKPMRTLTSYLKELEINNNTIIKHFNN